MRRWLQDARLRKNMSKHDLARSVCVDISAIGKYERGERRPSVEKAKEIAEVLGFDWTLFYPDEKVHMDD